MLLFAPHHSATFAQRVADALGISLANSEERQYDGGEHKMRPLDEVRGHDVFVVQSLCGDAQASANDKLCRLLFFCGAVKDAGARRVTACLPYLAYARKDRRTQPCDPITTRYVAAVIEAVGIDRVVALDVHNEAAFDNAFRREAIRLEAAATFAEAFAATPASVPLVVASPDIGGVKRAQQLRETLAHRLGRELGFAFMEKRRVRGIVSGEALVGDVAGSEVLVYDDLIASGTTVLRAAQAARRAGAHRVHVIATHAAFQPGALQLFAAEGPDSVLVSDSVALPAAFEPMQARGLKVCSVAPLFASTIAQLSRCE